MASPNGIKVKQDMIDFIKAQGMTKALKHAGELKAAGTKGEAEFLEGVRRMYGERRLTAAASAAKTSPKSPTNYSSNSKNQTAPKTAAYAQGKKSMVNSKSDYPAPKKAGFHLTGKEVAAGLTTAAILALTKGKGTAAAAKVAAQIAPKTTSAVAKAAAKGGVAAGKAGSKVSGAVLKGKDLAALKAGQAAAKAGKPVTQAQYDAMKANAAARGIKVNPKAKVVEKSSQSVASVSGLTGLAGQLAERGTAVLAKRKAAEAAAKAAKAAAAKKAAAAAAKKAAPKLPPKVSTKKLALAGTSATTMTSPRKKN